MIQTQSAPAAAQAVAGATLAVAPSHHRRSPEPPQAASPGGKLKYADPRSLPSYPTSGLRPGGAVAGAVATLGRTTYPQEPVEMWRPDSAASASAAAVFAKDHKLPSLREPTPDDAGSRAAILAVESADAALNKPHDDDGWHSGMGNTAANQAFVANRPLSPESDSLLRGGTAAAQASYTDYAQSKEVEPPPTVINDGSLAAAIGAMSMTKQATADSPKDTKTLRRRSGSVDAPTASANALLGATAAHRELMKTTPPEDPGAVSVTTMTREMFTSYPPVKPETDERDEDQRRHQMAVEMAKRMYRQQQEQRQELGQTADTSGDSSVIFPNPHSNLQDAAYRLAQERLAKLQDEHQKNQEYKNYYTEDLGNEQVPQQRRLSFIAKLRGQSEDDSRADARRRQRRTRQEMPFFCSQPSQAERTERQRAREALLAAAHRNVKAQLQGMDDQANRDAGRANPIQESASEGGAHRRAHPIPPVPVGVQPEDERKGKVDIGGGRFMDASEIDAIAARRVRPIMDDLDRSVAAERARMDTLRSEEEHRRDELRRQKSRERERKEMDRRFREEDKQSAKARKLQAKQDAKARKEEAKVAKAERKRQVKEQKQRRKQNQVSGQQSEVVRADQSRQESSGLGVTHGNADEGDHQTRGGSRAEGATAGVGQGAASQERRASHQESPRRSHQGSARESRRQSTLDSHQGSSRHSQQGTARESRFGSIADPQQTGHEASNQGSNPGSSKGSSSPIHKVAGWFKSRLSRKKASEKESKPEERPKGFVGGAALRNSGDHDPGKATGSHEQPRRERGEDSRGATTGEAGPLGGSHENLEAPRQLARTSTDRLSGSPARDSRFREIIDQ